jgi:molybdate transport system substrate-binding protein
MKKRNVFLFLLTAFCVVLIIYSTGCSKSDSSTSAEQLLIFAAAGTKPPLDEAAKIFEQKYGTSISINYGGGGQVLSNMVLSKVGDVYIAPEQRFMNGARAEGAVDAETKAYNLAYMIPAIGVKKGNPQNIESLTDLARPGIKVVMGNPETTLLGEIVPQILQKAGLYDRVKQNIITNVPQVTDVITALKMSQVDAGFIWHYFGVTSSNEIDVIWIPRQYVTGIGEIQGAVASFSHSISTAQMFVDFLVSPEGQEIFQKNGYITDSKETDQYWLANQ